jgi:DNA primase
MKVITTFLTEKYPDHPTTKVYQNITEFEIWNYWASVEQLLLKWIDNRYITLLLRIDDQLIFKRKIKDKFIKLSNDNYIDIINGRLNAVYVTIPTETNYAIIDIDPSPNTSRKDTILTMNLCKKLINDKLSHNIESLNSSANGIHMNIYLDKKYNVNELKQLIKTTLISLESDKITVDKPGRNKRSGMINLDLSSMKENGIHISRYSLTKNFYICDVVEKPLRKLV